MSTLNKLISTENNKEIWINVLMWLFIFLNSWTPNLRCQKHPNRDWSAAGNSSCLSLVDIFCHFLMLIDIVFECQLFWHCQKPWQMQMHKFYYIMRLKQIGSSIELNLLYKLNNILLSIYKIYVLVKYPNFRWAFLHCHFLLIINFLWIVNKEITKVYKIQLFKNNLG